MTSNISYFYEIQVSFDDSYVQVPSMKYVCYLLGLIGYLCIVLLANAFSNTIFVERGVRAIQNVLKILTNPESGNTSLSNVKSRSLHSSSVYEPAILYIDDIDKNVTEKDIWNALKKMINPLRHNKKVMEEITLHTVKDKSVRNKMIGLITIPRMYLHASGILSNVSSTRKWSIKEVKKIGPLSKPGRLWLTKTTKLPASGEYSSTLPLDLRKFDINFGYRNVDGGLSFQGSMIHLKVSCLNSMVKRCSETGIERIVLITHGSENKSNSVVSWCKVYSKFFYFTAAMPKGNKVSSRNKFDNMVRNPACVAIGPLRLAYKSDDLARTETLQTFKEQVELGCTLRKSLMFVLRQTPAHQDFLDVLRLNKSRLPPCGITVLGNYSDKFPELISEFDFYVVIQGQQLRQGWYGWLKKMLKEGDIPMSRVLLQSNAPNTDYECQTYQDFKNKFLRKRITYLHEEAVHNIKDAFTCCDEHKMPCDSRILHVVLELLASLVNLPPTALAPTMKRNCEQFYMFDA